MTDQFGSDETGKEPGNAPGFEHRTGSRNRRTRPR